MLANSRTIRVFIADDHGLVRAGLRSLLSVESDMSVVGEAADGLAALSLIGELKPDVALLDISMPGLTGIEVARQLRSTLSATRFLMVTMHEDSGVVNEALEAGAAGYISKRVLEAELTRAIRAVFQGEAYVIAGRQQTEQGVAPPPKLESLSQDVTEAERKLLSELARGVTTAEAARKLGVDATTADFMRRHLIQKLGLHNRAELLRYALDHGLLSK